MVGDNGAIPPIHGISFIIFVRIRTVCAKIIQGHN